MLPKRRPTVWAIIAAVAFVAVSETAIAQTDWQYPDPYFGVIEIEKSPKQPAVPPRRELAKPEVKPHWNGWRRLTRPQPGSRRGAATR